MTREEFIEKAIRVHDHKYDYSKVEYTNNRTKVEIICQKHGVFWQPPHDHLSNHGCPGCSNEQKGQYRVKGRDKFIEEAKVIHGDKYDYSKVKYRGVDYEVEIICPKHGSFWRPARNHIYNLTGCPKCGRLAGAEKRTKKHEDFIAGARAIHGKKYDYSRVEYYGDKIKVEIICPEHGGFWQTPHSHIANHGCPACAIETTAMLRTKDFDTFIKQAKEIHGSKYDYSKINYKNGKTKIEIICHEHGVFRQSPENHINQKQGCPRCGKLQAAQSKTKDLETFIQEAEVIHGKKYDYSKVIYKKMMIKVEIICSQHGSFWQAPDNHIYQGQGCPVCSASKGEQRIADLLRFWHIQFIHEKRFNACRNKGCLPFDFYFRIGKHQFLIEYDGELHYRPIDYFGGDDHLAQVRLHDSIKTQFAQDHGFILIRIPYTDYDNIETILRTVIETHTGRPPEAIQVSRRPKSAVTPLRGHQPTLL